MHVQNFIECSLVQVKKAGKEKLLTTRNEIDVLSLLDFSNAREAGQLVMGVIEKTPVDKLIKDMKEDQEANEWGRKGGDPNKYRPRGLPKQYRK